jgi:hypothetical protein
MKSLQETKAMSNVQRSTGRGPARSAARERFWRQQVSRQTRSKLTVREFCAQAGLSGPSFYAWRRELSQRDSGARLAEATAHTEPSAAPSSANFLPVTIGPAAAGPIEVVLPSGLVIRVPAQDAATLRTVLELLEPRSC